ncbi:MAG TPA: energy transducer TonB, partial [Chitinophagaceae bacterium]|nr:energy transducer TonB [Chitinophagaceae bacterium]
PPEPKPQKIQMEQFTPPKITNDDVKPEEMPPTTDELEDVKIGTIDREGEKDDNIVAPPIDDGDKGIIQAPPKKDKEPDIYIDVQIESTYPGGLSAWLRYLTKTLPRYYTDNLVEQGIQGRVVVQFVVDTEGNVSDVHGVEGPKALMEAAEKVIRMSGKWTPAIQNGHKVKSYKRQPIMFQVQQE